MEPGSSATAPMRVVLCEATCARFQAATAARVNVVFGCETKVID